MIHGPWCRIPNPSPGSLMGRHFDSMASARSDRSRTKTYIHVHDSKAKRPRIRDDSETCMTPTGGAGHGTTMSTCIGIGARTFDFGIWRSRADAYSIRRDGRKAQLGKAFAGNRSEYLLLSLLRLLLCRFIRSLASCSHQRVEPHGIFTVFCFVLFEFRKTQGSMSIYLQLKSI